MFLYAWEFKHARWMVEYARTTFASRAAIQFCRSTSSSLIVLEPELELIVNAAGRHGLSVTRDGFAFSVDGEEVCVRGWSLANLTPAVASDMASKIPGLAEAQYLEIETTEKLSRVRESNAGA